MVKDKAKDKINLSASQGSEEDPSQEEASKGDKKSSLSRLAPSRESTLCRTKLTPF